MTNQEFSNEFDILYNNIMSNQAPGLDEYEKSVFLTKAQDEIVKSYFNPKLNKVQEGFDNNERRQIDFSMIIKTVKATKITNDSGLIKLYPNEGSELYQIPERIMMFINESLKVTRDGNSISLVIIPLNYKEYNRLMTKPYKRPIKNQAWRLNIDSISDSNKPIVEIVAGYGDTIIDYTIRYVKRPQAIILTNLEGELSIDGEFKEQPCELDPILHHEILQRAVELAKAAYTGDLNSQLALGVNSETPMGIVQPSR